MRRKQKKRAAPRGLLQLERPHDLPARVRTGLPPWGRIHQGTGLGTSLRTPSLDVLLSRLQNIILQNSAEVNC